MNIRYKKVENRKLFGLIFLALGVLYGIIFFFTSSHFQIHFYHYILISILFIAVGIYQFIGKPMIYIQADFSQISVRQHHILMKKISRSSITHIHNYDTYIEIVHYSGIVKIWFKYLDNDAIDSLKTLLKKPA